MRNLFPSWVSVVVVGRDVLASESAWQEELKTLSARAVTKRRDEFSMGRIAARRALVDLGSEPVPILPDPMRAPIWPRAIVGSITHTNDIAAAAVAPAERCAGLGIDIEQVRSLQPSIDRQVADDEERAWIASDMTRFTLLFSAKESIYKAFFPIRREYFGFSAVHLQWETPRFIATLTCPMSERWGSGAQFPVECHRDGERVWTAVCLPP